MTRLSTSRKYSSPLFVNISFMVLFSRFYIRLSVETYFIPSRRESSEAIVVFPVPMKPTNTMFFMPGISP